MNHVAQLERSPWPHRLALVLACATFPLVWVGGLVTTTDAGMAVPDWPNTYGYNLFLYPWQTWLFGPWDLFIEHGHRLLASLVGMLTIGVVVLVYRRDSRAWLRNVAYAALALVCFQGVLGGMRVRLDERTLALLHGCTGPLFFAVAVSLVVFTSRRWMADVRSVENESAGTIQRFAGITTILAYLQLVLGAIVRHMPVDAQPSSFNAAVKSHVGLAAVLTFFVLLLAAIVWRGAPGVRPLRGLAISLLVLVMLQVALGSATWVVKFAVPTWVQDWVAVPTIAVREGSLLQTHVITAHVAIGSLILVTSLALTLYAQRLLVAAPRLAVAARRGMGAAV